MRTGLVIKIKKPMESLANYLSKLSILIGIIAFIIAVVAHAAGGEILMGVGYWGFTMTAIFFELLAIALNSVIWTERA